MNWIDTAKEEEKKTNKQKSPKVTSMSQKTQKFQLGNEGKKKGKKLKAGLTLDQVK